LSETTARLGSGSLSRPNSENFRSSVIFPKDFTGFAHMGAKKPAEMTGKTAQAIADTGDPTLKCSSTPIMTFYKATPKTIIPNKILKPKT